MNTPKISVVMPVYNAERFLSEAIESILNQTFKDFELIIINDGSTDNSLEIIKKYKAQDERIVLISRENRGLVYSLNEGIEKAEGKYIARMDADDISLENRFSKQFEVLEDNTDIDIVGCDYQLIDKNSNVVGKTIVPKTEKDILLTLCYSVPFAHPSVMIRKSIFQYHKYEESPAEDYLLWSRVYKKNNFFNIGKPLLKYRYHYGESFSDMKRLQMIKAESTISYSFITYFENEIFAALKEERSKYATRALVSLYFNYSRLKAVKTLKNNPYAIPGFIKFFFRHYLRSIYWIIKRQLCPQ